MPKRAGSPFVKRPTKKTKVPAKTLSAAVKKAVYGLAEKKNNIVQIDEELVSTINQGLNWWHVTNLQGTSTDAARIGRSVTLDSVRLRGVLNNNSTTATHYVRLVIGYFNDFTAPSLATPLFEGANGYQASQPFGVAGVSTGLNSIYQPLSSQHFQCLVDRVMCIAPVTAIDATQSKYFDISKALRGTKIQFDGGTAGVPTNLRKALYVGMWSAPADDDTGAGTNLEISGAIHLKYTDL